MSGRLSPLAARLRRRIETDGPIGVDVFMEAALADPDHGYYRTRDPLGRGGDFVTAPEISQMFGELIGLWAAVAWTQDGAAAPVNMVELGPGRGTLMADALRAIRGVPDFTNAIRLHLVETGPALIERQKESLKGSGFRPEWHETLASVPPGPLLAIANEFFDALPIHQFVRRADGWRERCVGWAEGFSFVDGGVVEGDFPGAEDGQILERGDAAMAVVADLSRKIVADGGVALIVDYGHTGGIGDTLQAIKGHAFHPPLESPGTADLTAHVDFAALAAAARGAGAETFGPLPQGTFLERLGLKQRAERLKEKADAKRRAEIDLARARLADPRAMGDLFKVLAIAPRGASAPPGFSLPDLSVPI